jgi:hypothetical protein
MIKRLRDQKRTVEEQLDHLNDMSADAWTNMRSGVDTALAELETSYQQISASNEVVK